MLESKNRLKKNWEFQLVYKKGRSYVGRYAVLYLKENGQEYTRFGFTVSKKIGNAVVRNSIKRKMREICRLNIDNFSSGYDLIFVARKKIKGIRYSLVEQEIVKLCSKAGIWQ